MKRATTLFGLISVLGFAPGLASAGLSMTSASYSVSCGASIGSDGVSIGSCMGTMQAFRSSPDPNAYAVLRVNASGVAYFAGSFNGKNFLCMFPDTYDSQYLASFAGDLENSHFKIFARGGICTDVTVERGSPWPKY